MAIRKRTSLLLFVTLIVAAYFSSATAFHLPRSEGLHGRKLLSQLSGKIEPQPRKAAHQVGDTISGDYGPPEPDPPIHQDPPTPFTMKSGDIHTDYAPAGLNPSNDYHDYPPPGVWDFHTRKSKTAKGLSDYTPVEPHPPTDYHDYPPPATMKFHTWNSKTANGLSDYTPVEPHPPSDYHDYPPPATMTFHS